ncbi:hypothetical protein GTY65_36880 [Streptomyces sp. SID8379]|uniref:hypothetical protein n=1 Tax=unclassified Streptomyces TaxID=2593676 RepID=UPI00037D009C|nr:MULTISPECIES: hypothetical protein [unclassified Streptomyces]MYW69602.1 hypothetical protein [Streptomyces sp. SID8379]
MKRSGPLYTLFAGLVLGLFMLSLNATTGEAGAPYKGAPVASPSTVSPSTGASTSTSPGTGASPSQQPSPSPSQSARGKTSYAGRTTDDAAAVSVSVNGDKAIAYYCDGRTQESWLKGNVEDDGSMKLSGSHGAKLEGTLKDERIRGTVEVGDRPSAFTAKKAVKPSGLYRATTEVRGAKVDGGWIVLPDGRQVGIVKRDDKPSTAPPIDPESGAVTVDGEQLTARPVVP